MTGIDRGTNISSSPARPAMTIFYAIFPKILVNFGSFWKLSTFGSTFGSWRSSNRTSVVVCDRLCLRLLRWSLKRWIWSRWKICALVIFFSGIWEPDYFDWVFWHNWMMLDVHPHGFLVMYGRFDPFPTWWFGAFLWSPEAPPTPPSRGTWMDFVEFRSCLAKTMGWFRSLND